MHYYHSPPARKSLIFLRYPNEVVQNVCSQVRATMRRERALSRMERKVTRALRYMQLEEGEAKIKRKGTKVEPEAKKPREQVVQERRNALLQAGTFMMDAPLQAGTSMMDALASAAEYRLRMEGRQQEEVENGTRVVSQREWDDQDRNFVIDLSR